ncbi:amidohydrolase [Cesiribacter andamanensis]|uniref:Putative hydrolase YxeP n=1 Tax=Cesiribacter andamanensis AMV16 TaxID=1279009 RepID=M7N893_9BACT|nr:amidohydrolase [Cesiribacter andamanensis]EMR04798.1 putative hydrolase YxeP [Cesiribacter andamanensis AMV16]
MTLPELSPLLAELTQLRHELHRLAELSGQETDTAQHLQHYLQRYSPGQLLSGLGSGTGLVAIFEGKKLGPTLMLRADMDALPIADANQLPYSSRKQGVSHKCGHDGHMSMLAGLAPLLARHPLKRGRLLLLMQPAEETGQGARALLKDERFTSLAPDYIFGLHNLPGYPLGQVVLREGTFCPASKGLHVTLRGRTAHAAEPELGHSPANALAELLQQLPKLPPTTQPAELSLLTLTHARLGDSSFGISPGEAELLATLRANLQPDMDRLSEAVEHLLHQTASAQGLGLSLEYREVFPATTNGAEAFACMQRAATAAGLDVHLKQDPFRWSEDFGCYNQLAPSGFFGLGAGLEQPNLHNAAYDFPDALLPYGLRMYWALIGQLLGH